MKHSRNKYQQGSIVKRQRKTGPPVWEFQYNDPSQSNPRQSLIYSTVTHPTKRAVMKAVQPILLRVNGCDAYCMREQPTFGVLIERFIQEERIREIVAQEVGAADGEGLKYSTALGYLTNLRRHILPRWKDEIIANVTPAMLDAWVKDLHCSSRDIGKPAPPMSPKSKGHIKSLMNRLYKRGMLWGMIDLARNPVELVEVRGVSKRRKKPLILTVEQFHTLLPCVPQPYRTMLMVALCLGLRVNEVLALKWSDFDFEAGTVQVVRGVVHGRVGTVKTEYSEDELPIDPLFAAELMEWRAVAPKSEEDWVFLNPDSEKLYHASPIQQDYIRAAGVCLVACPHCGARAGEWCVQDSPTPNGGRLPLHDERWEAAGKFDGVGWHTMRHTHRALLDATGAPVGVQQKLMRHAQVSTTMNTYGNAYMESKRDANSNVVSRIFGQKDESRETRA